MDSKKLNIDANTIQALIALVIQLIGLLPKHEQAKAHRHISDELGKLPRAE